MKCSGATTWSRSFHAGRYNVSKSMTASTVSANFATGSPITNQFYSADGYSGMSTRSSTQFPGSVRLQRDGYGATALLMNDLHCTGRSFRPSLLGPVADGDEYRPGQIRVLHFGACLRR